MMPRLRRSLDNFEDLDARVRERTDRLRALEERDFARAVLLAERDGMMIHLPSWNQCR
ncbi:hypothetical protein PCCS19_29230 [Paenibacillus sp. CCS19]|nr:hypothetical protein PCCS19_29230 [Paenibacillus cellulosilyticus]